MNDLISSSTRYAKMHFVEISQPRSYYGQGKNLPGVVVSEHM